MLLQQGRIRLIRLIRLIGLIKAISLMGKMSPIRTSIQTCR